MHHVSGPEWELRFGSVFRRMFRGTDPFVAPFTEALAARALIYPVSFILDRPQFESVLSSAADARDQQVCVSITEEFDGLSGDGASHWLLDPWDYTDYSALPRLGVLENAIYSPSGSWAILISHEQHALIGGSKAFLNDLETTFPEFSASLPDFMSTWAEHRRRRNVDTNWIGALLEHLYGRATAEDEMKRYALS